MVLHPSTHRRKAKASGVSEAPCQRRMSLRYMSAFAVMKPKPKKVCGKCAQAFTARQQFLLRSGPCASRFHCRCINITGDEYENLMEGGISSYKCNSCSKRSDADGYASTFTGAVSDEMNEDLEILAPDHDIRHLLELLCAKIDALSSQVTLLKAHNAALHDQLSRNTTVLLRHSGDVAASAAEKSRDASSYASGVWASHPSAVVHQAAGSSRGNVQATARPSFKDAEGFTLVQRKQRVNPSVGMSENSTLSSVARPPMKKAVCVTVKSIYDF